MLILGLVQFNPGVAQEATRVRAKTAATFRTRSANAMSAVDAPSALSLHGDFIRGDIEVATSRGKTHNRAKGTSGRLKFNGIVRCEDKLRNEVSTGIGRENL